MTSEERTVWCGNLNEKVSEEILYELFLQAAPIERVCIPNDREGRKSTFGFVTFKHPESVNYVVRLLNGTTLFEKKMIVKPRNGGNNQYQNPQRNNEIQFNQNNASPWALPHLNFINCDELVKMGSNMLPSYCATPIQYGINNSDRQEQYNYREEKRRDNYKPYSHNRGSSSHNSNYNSHNNPNKHGRNLYYNESRNKRRR